MNATSSAAPPASEFDRAALVAMVGEQPEVLRELFELYIDSCARCADGIDAAVSAGDVPAVSMHAHRLRSAALVVGARSLGRIAGELEQVAYQKGACGLAQIRALRADCRREADAALAWIRQQLEQLPP